MLLSKFHHYVVQMLDVEWHFPSWGCLNFSPSYHSVARLADNCQAFRAIDEQGAGYIETAKMSELLVSKGTPFRAKEIEAFLSIAKVRGSGETRTWCSGGNELVTLRGRLFGVS